MKIVIIADIHDNLTNLKKCLDWCRDALVDVLICAGDITNGETVRFMSENFDKKVYVIKGNCGIFEESEINDLENIEYLGRMGRIELDGRWIGIVHEPFFIEEIKKEGKCDIVFYGHTHKPWIEEKVGVLEVNPGTLGGVFQRATFGYYETEGGLVSKPKLELKVLDRV